MSDGKGAEGIERERGRRGEGERGNTSKWYHELPARDAALTSFQVIPI